MLPVVGGGAVLGRPDRQSNIWIAHVGHDITSA
jgi:hypothetical protein